ncbi:hypothetical protein [Fodinicola acaciae]|uniref:hypothetical protein n=1 Tax=Fodinicola acaciae TaxID=2681555 RepID=UPI0013D0E31B|nr:hypothetical protein [Fodinicola acaciae]
MSAASRGRKKKTDYFASILETFGELIDNPDALAAETMASSLISTELTPVEPYGVDDSGLLPMIEYAASKADRWGLCFLRAIAAVAISDQVRTTAGKVAETIAADGVREPAWVATDPEPGRCWQLSDVFGDGMLVLAQFSRGDETHAVSGFVEPGFPYGISQQVGVTDDLEAALATMKAEAEEDELYRFETISMSTAMRLLRDGIPNAVDLYGGGPGDDDDPAATYFALVYARCRSLGLAFTQVSDDEPALPEEADRIVAEFLGTLPGKQPVARALAGELVSFGWTYDAQRMCRVSPSLFERFLLEYVPNEVKLTPEAVAALPDAMRAWCAWVAGQMRLSAAARGVLATGLEETLEQFPARYKNSRGSRSGHAPGSQARTAEPAIPDDTPLFDL